MSAKPIIGQLRSTWCVECPPMISRIFARCSQNVTATAIVIINVAKGCNELTKQLLQHCMLPPKARRVLIKQFCCTAHKSIFIITSLFFILFIYMQYFSLLITFLIKFYQLTKRISKRFISELTFFSSLSFCETINSRGQIVYFPTCTYACMCV